jgi:hypothetical protein
MRYWVAKRRLPFVLPDESITPERLLNRSKEARIRKNFRLVRSMPKGRPAAIIDDDRLPEEPFQVHRHRARQGIRGTAGRKR